MSPMLSAPARPQMWSSSVPGSDVGPIAAAVSGRESCQRRPADLRKSADERIDVVDAQIEERREDVERPQMQRRHLRQAEQMQTAPRRRPVLADVVQHLGDVLRQRLQVPARAAVEQRPAAVRFARDAAEDGALGPFPVAPAEDAGEGEVAVEPGLHDRFLAVIFVVADQIADAGRQIAGPATAETREPGDRLGARAVDGSFAEILERPKLGIVAVKERRQYEEPIRRVVEELGRRRMGPRIDEERGRPRGPVRGSGSGR